MKCNMEPKHVTIFKTNIAMLTFSLNILNIHLPNFVELGTSGALINF